MYFQSHFMALRYGVFDSYTEIDKLYNRAICCYLGTGISVPMMAAKSELRWMQPISHAHINMICFYVRLKLLPESHITKQVFH